MLKKTIEGYKKFIMVDGMICIETDESDNLLKDFVKRMLDSSKTFIDKFSDLSVDNFGKQSDTLITNQNLHFRLDRQMITPKYDTSWGNHQIQLNSQLMNKNKKNPTSREIIKHEGDIDDFESRSHKGRNLTRSQCRKLFSVTKKIDLRHSCFPFRQLASQSKMYQLIRKPKL